MLGNYLILIHFICIFTAVNFAPIYGLSSCRISPICAPDIIDRYDMEMSVCVCSYMWMTAISALFWELNGKFYFNTCSEIWSHYCQNVHPL